MLISYGASNFCCFKEWMEINLSLSPKIAKEISNNSGISNLLCLKGGNASGKTSAIKALQFITYFTQDSFKYKPDEDIFFDTYFNNDASTEFYIKFMVGKIEYEYQFELTRKKIINEKIYKKEKRNTLIFHRNNNKIEKNSLFDNKKAIILRSNASIVSTANQYGIKEIKSIYDFFISIFTNVGYVGLQHELFDESTLFKVYFENSDLLEFAKEKIRQFDTGIMDIKIDSFANEKKEKIFYPVFLHQNENKIGKLLYHTQSSGTKALFLYLVFYFSVLKNGGVLALDEFDINLHPDILPHLVKWFENKKINSKNAQLIFSTHNADVLDLLGKYRTYFFNKENGASYCYRLDEINENIIRNDRSITNLYKAGKIGGIPRI